LGPFTLQQILMYGGLAALVYWFVLKPRQEVVGTETAASAPKLVATPKAA
jgi:hypothetical protein